MEIPTAANITWPSPSKNPALLSAKLQTTNPITIAKSHHFTEKAEKILYELAHHGYNIYHADETLEHDGFDAHGPESDIWHFHVFTYNSVYEPIQLVFGWENWFYPGNNTLDYEFIMTCTLAIPYNEECKAILEAM
jgi:hypothetical protein